jgi:poly-gamma-glutamate capsule biosynthesis protein CapA/YwtB (metallophosphatase superfamily)
MQEAGEAGDRWRTVEGTVRLFLCGDVMAGRGIDQILPQPCDPGLHEPFVRDAREYVRLAEEASGPIPRPVDPEYIWGDAPQVWEAMRPDVRLINLETSVTRHSEPWPLKGVHYRMSPENSVCLRAAKIDAVSLANNHVLDWGLAGMSETLSTLNEAGIATAGAGKDAATAQSPAIVSLGNLGRILIFSIGLGTSGVPSEWAAGPHSAGIFFAADTSDRLAQELLQVISAARLPGDIVVLSLHWGGNWDYEIVPSQRDFAHQVIDCAGVDLVHGHSSHHVKGIEVYQKHPILYGCGDFLTDYEGIRGREYFRGDLGLMYFAELDPRGGELQSLRMVPTCMQCFQVRHALQAGTDWLAETLTREGRALGTAVTKGPEGTMELLWS